MRDSGICIFIMGKQRAGKDTIAGYLVEKYGFKQSRLAGPVYTIARDVFGMVGKDRGLLIKIGSRLREIDPLVLPKSLWRQHTGDAAAPLPADVRLVISDARFPNEWEFFKERGGFALRVEASQEVRSSRPGYHPQFETDATETGLDNAPTDAVIHNEGSFADLYAAVDRVVQERLGLQLVF